MPFATALLAMGCFGISDKSDDGPRLTRYSKVSQDTVYVGERFYDSLRFSNPDWDSVGLSVTHSRIALSWARGKIGDTVLYLSWAPELKDTGTTDFSLTLKSGNGASSHSWRFAVIGDRARMYSGMRRIRAGTFWMGDTVEGSPRDSIDTIVSARRVVIEKDFWMDTVEVTLAKYHQYTPFNRPSKECLHPSLFPPLWGCTTAEERGVDDALDKPAVTRYIASATSYCSYRSRVWDIKPVLREGTFILESGCGLPTEEEWEYAARGGLEASRYPWGSDTAGLSDRGNFSGVAGRDKYHYAAPVGSFPPNAFGLRDMLGNVSEWVRTFKVTPARRASITKGGSYASDPAKLKMSDFAFENDIQVDVGFRCICRE